MRLRFPLPISRLVCRNLPGIFWLIAAGALLAQTPTPAPPAGFIHGLVKSGNMPLPGATVTATNTLTGQKAITWTAVDGTYDLQVPVKGRYVIRVQMAGFAPFTQEVVVTPPVDSVTSVANVQADLEMVLLSRARQAPPPDSLAQIPGAPSGARGNTGANASRFQSLSVMQSEGADQAENGADQSAPAGMPGMAPDSATESVAVSGTTQNPMGSLSGDDFRERVQEFQQQGGGPGGLGGGGFGGGRGGGGFGGGGPIFFGGGRGGRFDINRPHGSLFYTVGDSALNAGPFALTDQPSTKPSGMQNRFGGSIGGPLNIPHIYNGGTKTFYFINYTGNRSENPYDQYSTVPTLLERMGDFSQTTITSQGGSGPPTQVPVQLYNPFTAQLIPGANLANSGLTISPIAQGLLPFIPMPNLPGAQKNFHFVTSVNSDSDDLNLRINHTFGAAPAPRQRGGGGGFGGRGGARAPRNNLTIGVHYHATASNQSNPFPSVGGTLNLRAWDVPISYTRSIGKLTNTARVDFNTSRSRTQNLFAFSQDITGTLGITGVSQNPFDWGLPNLSFTHYGSLNDINPSFTRNQTVTFGDAVVWNHGKHSWRFGGDFRRIELNSEADTDPRGTFVFTGENTAQFVNGQPVPNTGYDFADFLLGLPQQTSLATALNLQSTNTYHFRGNSWDAYAQDEWKLRGNLTLNLGVRWEYVSPFSELNKRISNLILSPAVLNPSLSNPTLTQVLSGQDGYPSTLVHPDRNNFAPRIGIAWKPLANMVVRTGYGINYNTGAFQTIATKLAFQPPFANTETNVQTAPGELTLANGFPTPPSGLLTNSYAVDPNYRLGYVQLRFLDIQQQIRPTLLLNLDYTGSKGTHLDNEIAPNSPITGIRIPTAQAFLWQTDQGYSSANSGSVRLRKRLQRGVSIGGTYTWSKVIDDVSSIGGGGFSLAQDPFNLAAERGLSSLDQPQKFTADYLWELPFGHDRRWLAGNSPWRAIFGDWTWSGDWTIADGTFVTPTVLGNFSDVNRGINGVLRADVVSNVPVTVPNPSILDWFNTAAFTAPPAGQYGNARRNSIEGPGQVVFDMSFNKVIPMKESRSLEIRASASNTFNHPNFTSIDTTVNSPTFGEVVGAGAMRTITMTARFRF